LNFWSIPHDEIKACPILGLSMDILFFSKKTKFVFLKKNKIIPKATTSFQHAPQGGADGG
jgi:hypothetical protein